MRRPALSQEETEREASTAREQGRPPGTPADTLTVTEAPTQRTHVGFTARTSPITEADSEKGATETFP